jgi:hypothetical protein
MYTTSRAAYSMALTESMRALVRDDGLHGRGFTHHAAGRADAVFLQIADQSAYAEASHLFVVTQRIVQRRIQAAVVEGGHEFWRLRESDADESLHVGGAAREQLAVPLHGDEGIGIPVLPIHRHHIGVTR